MTARSFLYGEGGVMKTWQNFQGTVIKGSSFWRECQEKEPHAHELKLLFTLKNRDFLLDFFKDKGFVGTPQAEKAIRNEVALHDKADIGQFH